MTKQYETVFIFTPILSDEEVKKATQEYVQFLKDGGAEIVAEDLWGMRQLAYPIKKKTIQRNNTDITGETFDGLQRKTRRQARKLRAKKARRRTKK